MSELSNEQLEFLKKVLDNLPFVITVQNKALKIIYENQKAIEVFGSRLNTHCWERWTELPGYGTEPCKDCIRNIVKSDYHAHTTFRPVVSEDGTQRLFKIEHIPILDDENNFSHFIEILDDITDYVYEPGEVVGMEAILSNLKFVFVKVGELGSEIITKDKINIPSVNDEETFLEMLTVYLITGVLQNYRTDTGLYGPLPVLDQPRLVSFAYPFGIKDPEIKDPRKQGMEIAMLILIINRNHHFIFEKRAKIDKYLKQEIEKFVTIQRITNKEHENFERKVKNFLKRLNVDK